MALATRRPREKTPVQSRVRDEARALYRKAILDAAEEVFAERGVVSARVQDIAARARLAVGTIYNHFEQKEDILVALLEERTSDILEAFRPQAADGDTFEQQLVARVVRLFSYIQSHRPFFQLASDHGLFGGPTASAEKLLGGKKVPFSGAFEAAVQAVVDEGLASGALGAAPRGLLALQLRHSMRTGSMWVKGGGEGDLASVARQVVEMFLFGVAPRASAKSSGSKRAIRT